MPGLPNRRLGIAGRVEEEEHIRVDQLIEPEGRKWNLDSDPKVKNFMSGKTL